MRSTNPIVVILLLLAVTGFSSEPVGSKHEPPADLLGTWKVDSIRTSELTQLNLDVRVVVQPRALRLEGAGLSEDSPREVSWSVPTSRFDNPYRALFEDGVLGVESFVDAANQITVFWYHGIYRIKDDKLEVALVYCGQGLKQHDVKVLALPKSLDDPIGPDEIRIVLSRN